MKRKFVKVMFFGALALSTVTYVGCKDYDDDIDNLQTQIDANKASIADLQAKVNDGKWVKDVVKIEGGFKITFNNGDAYDIVNGKNGATPKVEIKEGYWYIDNVKQIAATGPQGPVGPAGPAGKSPFIGDGTGEFEKDYWYFYDDATDKWVKGDYSSATVYAVQNEGLPSFMG